MAIDVSRELIANRRRTVRNAVCCARIPWDSVNLLTYIRMGGIMVIILTADGSIAMINQSGSDMLGCESTSAVGLGWFDSFVCEQQREAAWNEYQKKLAAGPTQAAYMEHQVVGADGRRRVFALHGTPLVDENSVVGLMAFGEDITSRRSNEIQLNERIAELRCLYGISRLKDETGQDLQQFFRECLKLIPTTTKYPRLRGARIILDGTEYRTADCDCQGLQLSADIMISGQKAGVVEVCYEESTTTTTPGRKNTPEDYLRNLLEAVAREIGKHTQRIRTEEQLIRASHELEQDRKILHDKNVAMRELLSQIETEKANLVERLQTNISSSITPLIDRLKLGTDQNSLALLTELQSRLEGVASPFLGNLQQNVPNLTPREREICSLIRNGLSSKEIATNLSISELTVQKQRQHIRSKLGIANRKVNLTTYLQTI
ncbi:PAS domain S-box protein [candidate division GN15 bacterium]|nr:PAS domain S-box protein [candidate division GN15 bacterium]